MHEHLRFWDFVPGVENGYSLRGAAAIKIAGKSLLGECLWSKSDSEHSLLRARPGRNRERSTAGIEVQRDCLVLDSILEIILSGVAEWM